MGKSWNIPYFNSESPNFNWVVFPVPPPINWDHVELQVDGVCRDREIIKIKT